MAMSLSFFHGLLFLFGITLAFINVKASNFILSLAFGLIYLSIGVFNIASAIVVRFEFALQVTPQVL